MAVNLDFTALDDAVLDKLRADISELRTVETVGSEEQLTAPSSDQLPAAYTVINGAVYDPVEGVSGYQSGDVTITIFIKAKNLRGGGAARKAADGAYQIIAGVIESLLGFSPTTCGALQLVEVSAFSVSRNNAIYAVKFAADTYEES